MNIYTLNQEWLQLHVCSNFTLQSCCFQTSSNYHKCIINNEDRVPSVIFVTAKSLLIAFNTLATINMKQTVLHFSLKNFQLFYISGHTSFIQSNDHHMLAGHLHRWTHNNDKTPSDLTKKQLIAGQICRIPSQDRWMSESFKYPNQWEKLLWIFQ